MTFKGEEERLGLTVPEAAAAQSWVGRRVPTAREGPGPPGDGAGAGGRPGEATGGRGAAPLGTHSGAGLCGNSDHQMASEETLASNSSGL